MRYAWQVSDFTCEGCAASSSNPWFSGGGGIKQHRYSWAGAHTWVLSPTRAQRGSRPVDQLPVPRARRRASTPQKTLFTEDAGAHREPDADLHVPEPVVGRATPIITATSISRQLRDDLSITTGQHAWKFGAGAQSLPIRQSIRKAQRHVDVQRGSAVQSVEPRRRSCLFRDRSTQFTAALLNVALLRAERAVGHLRRG